MPAPGDYYYVNKRKIPLRRSTSAALLQSRPEAAAEVARRLGGRPGVTVDTASHGRMIARSEAGELEAMQRDDVIDAVRDVYTDPQGVELALTDEIVVGFAPAVTEDQRRQICAQLRLEVVSATNAYWLVRTTELGPSSALALANQLSEDDRVLFAEPNALQLPLHQSSGTPTNDLPTNSFVRNQWYLWGDGSGSPAHINVLEAWAESLGRGHPAVRIVVHDTGVDDRHPEIAANLLPGSSYGDASSSTRPIGGFPNAAHGTACAGIVAGAWNIGGIVGVAPECRIVPVRVQKMIPLTKFAETISWAASHGEVILGSWVVAESSIVTDAIAQAAKSGGRGRGAVCVFSAGNDAANAIGYPARLSASLPVIAVGASTNRDDRAPYGHSGDELDVLAPSDGGTRGIETTDIPGRQGYNREPDDGDYCRADEASKFGGTSAAAAVAAGVAALMLSVNSGLSASDVRELLRRTADKIDSAAAAYDPSGRSRTHGYGRINAGRAVRAAQEFQPVIA